MMRPMSKSLSQILVWLSNLPRLYKGILLILSDFIVLPLSFLTAMILRLGGWTYNLEMLPWWGYFLPALITIPIFIRLGLYRAVLRYIEEKVLFTLALGVSLSVLVLTACLAFLQWTFVPRLSLLIYGLIAFLYTGATRFAARYLLRHARGGGRRGRKNVVIYGAGNAGLQLAQALKNSPEYDLIAFIDDDRKKRGTLVMGTRVYMPDQLRKICQHSRVHRIILAIPSLKHARRVELINQLEPYRAQIQSLPGIAELVDGKVEIPSLREVSLDELLGRTPADPDHKLLEQCILGKTVLVTGAGGSIGSELCRQIIALNPKALILFESNEYALYAMEAELKAYQQKHRTQCNLQAVLGTVLDEVHLGHLMTQHQVDTVYHAAAYKHVPLVEVNAGVGVRNNVFGTLAVVRASLQANVKTFVLISTDKAVRPTNVMGASKRLAEQILQAFAARKDKVTTFCMVRFGNVLGSSGSVVPLFRAQIAQGGPVTVTHPDIIRYFMNIPEAAQLVIQAGAMGQGGDVFVLDMGQPVKILDLARRMIHLSGYEAKDVDNPNGDIEIRFTGLRPGEKLYEELLIGDNVSGTTHPLIMRAEEMFLPKEELDFILKRLEKACAADDVDLIRNLLQQAVPEFAPQEQVTPQMCKL